MHVRHSSSHSNQPIAHAVSESNSVVSDSLQCRVSCAVHGILQARILEWVDFPFSRGSFQPRNQTRVSCTAGRFFTNWAIREAHAINSSYDSYILLYFVICIHLSYGFNSKLHIKKQRHYFANKGPSSQGYGFSSGPVWMWELDCEESWATKNWCF